jgi:hypothetical protein
MQIPRPTRERQPAAITPQSSGTRKSRREAAPAPIGRRAQGEVFAASFDRLRDAVEEACGHRGGWEARVVAGVRAVLEFAAANPGATRALTIDARGTSAGSDRQADVLAYFTELLHEVAPAEKLFPIAADRARVASIAMIIRSHLVAGSTRRLPELAPDLACMLLMPYTGLAAARRESAESPPLAA